MWVRGPVARRAHVHIGGSRELGVTGWASPVRARLFQSLPGIGSAARRARDGVGVVLIENPLFFTMW